MNVAELRNFIEKFPNLLHHFKGVYFIDTLPRNLKNLSFIICNTDKHNGPGKHWIAFVKFKNYVECFDSLGINNDKKDLLLHYCRFNNVDFMYCNDTQYQSDESISCGKFVLYFLLERFYNLDLDFEELLTESFSFSHSINEKKVNNFFNEYHQN